MILKVKNLVKNYYKDNEKIEAVNNISYNFEKGKFYAIMGPSGSGKSTFLHLIGTLDTYDEGSVFINNIDVSSLDDLQLSKIRKEEIGFVFQSFYLNNNMKAYENVIMPIMLDKIPYKDKKEKGMGGIGGKMTPSAVIVIQDGKTKLVNIKNQDTVTKLLDMVPDVIDRFTSKDEKLSEDDVADILDSADESSHR